MSNQHELQARQESSPQEQSLLTPPANVQKSNWTSRLIFAGFASTLGSAVPAGYCIGVMNSPAQEMRIWCNETLMQRHDIHLSEAGVSMLWSAIVSIFLIGGAVGSLTGAWTADKFGRKGSFKICGLLFVIGGILFISCRTANSVEMLITGRFVVGLASGLTTSCLPMYLTELAPLVLRGTFGVFCGLGLTAGVVVGQIFSLHGVFGSAELWHVALSFYVILVGVCYVPLQLYPESPKWLYIIKKDKEMARRQLCILRGTFSVEPISKELAEMEVEANSRTQTSSFGEVLRDRKFLLPLIIVCAFQGGQQLSGINAIFYYSVMIFDKAGLTNQAAQWANLGAGSLNLATSLLSILLMSLFKRRPLMLFSTFFCALSLVCFAIMLHFIDDVSWFSIGCIACIYFYIFFFQFGIGPIPFFIGAELFEVAPRPVAMSMGCLASWSCNFVIGMTFPTLHEAWGAFVFLPFSVNCALLFALTRFFVPETKGRDAAEVAPMVANGFHSKGWKKSHDSAKEFRLVGRMTFALKTLGRLLEIHIRAFLSEAAISTATNLKSKSTEKALHRMVSTINKSLHKKRDIRAFLDIEGAFDNLEIGGIIIIVSPMVEIRPFTYFWFYSAKISFRKKVDSPSKTL